MQQELLAIQTEDVKKEIDLLRGWRKSCNAKRSEVIEKEILKRKTIAEKLGFVLTPEGTIENN